MKQLSIILISVSFFLTACGTNITDAQQTKIDALEIGIDTIVKNVTAIDSVEVIKMVTNFNARKNYLQKEMTDTIDQEALFALDRFVSLRKGMAFIGSEYSSIKSEALVMQKQIEDFQHDIDHKHMDETQFERYYALEKENFDRLEQSAERLVITNSKITEAYNERVIFVDSLINAYKNRVNE